MILLECIALMSKRFVHKDWPTLVPELVSHLQGQDNLKMKRALEAIKKICKKYRYTIRSDNLTNEMNYMIETLSPTLLQNMIFTVTTLQ